MFFCVAAKVRTLIANGARFALPLHENLHPSGSIFGIALLPLPFKVGFYKWGSHGEPVQLHAAGLLGLTSRRIASLHSLAPSTFYTPLIRSTSKIRYFTMDFSQLHPVMTPKDYLVYFNTLKTLFFNSDFQYPILIHFTSHFVHILHRSNHEMWTF